MGLRDIAVLSGLVCMDCGEEVDVEQDDLVLVRFGQFAVRPRHASCAGKTDLGSMPDEIQELYNEDRKPRSYSDAIKKMRDRK